jgi:hypothetical protein
MTRAKNKIIKSFFKKIGHREHTNDLFFDTFNIIIKISMILTTP